MRTLKGWWARIQATQAWRAWKRYGDHRGNLLAGGVGYFAFFSVFPAVLLAFTVFGLVLRNQPQLLEDTKNAINDLLPGFVKTADHPEGVIDVKAPTGAALSVQGIVSVVGLVLAGTGWLSALRDGMRAIFGAEGSPGNPVLAKLRDIGVLLLLGIGILLSAAVGAVAGAAASWVADLVGLGGQGWILTVVALLVGVALDGAIVAVMLRLLSGVKLPWQAVRNGAIFGGIGLTLLKKFGTVLLTGTTHNPLYLAIASVVGLLVWLNLMSRVILISAAWAANDLDTTGTSGLSAGQTHKLVEGPEPEPLTGVRARTDAGLPTFGQRAADRTSVAAGAVLGAIGAVALGSRRPRHTEPGAATLTTAAAGPPAVPACVGARVCGCPGGPVCCRVSGVGRPAPAPTDVALGSPASRPAAALRRGRRGPTRARRCATRSWARVGRRRHGWLGRFGVNVGEVVLGSGVGGAVTVPGATSSPTDPARVCRTRTPSRTSRPANATTSRSRTSR